jgi:zinc protease
VNAGAIWFNPQQGAFTDAFRIVLDEIDRFVEYGITDTELERQKANLRSSALDLWQNSKTAESPDIASRLVESVLNGTPLLSAEDEYRLALETIDALAKDEINTVIKQYLDKRGSRLLSIAPPDTDVPAKSAINRMWKRYRNAALGPYNDDLDSRPLFPPELAGSSGSIIAERLLSGGSDGAPAGFQPTITEFTLSNGATVIVCSTDYKESPP